MADSRVSVGASLAYAWSLWSAHWRSIWGVLALGSLAATIYTAGDFAGNRQLMVVGGVVYAVLAIMTTGAVFRIAFADRHAGDKGFVPGPMGFQWGRVEWRVLAATVLMLVLFTIIAMLAAVLIGGIVAGIVMNRGGIGSLTTPQAVAQALGPSGVAAVSVVGVICYAAFVYVAMRFALATAASADSGRVQVLRTWPLTKGEFWNLFLSILMIEIPAFLIGLLVSAAGLSSQIGLGPATTMGPAEAMASGLILGVLRGAILAPMLSGVLAYYYRNLGPANGTERPAGP